jgi:NAD(P)-dependent dehydrogenase (short-subunit alcohol dehydrogenase family)
MKKLDGKIALITGGSSGLGLTTAQQFVEDGAYVFITGRRESELDAAVRSIGNNVTGISGDVSNLEDLDRLYDIIKRDKGRLDVVFANAGGGSFSPLGTISEEHFDQTFDANVKGVLFTVQKSLPLLSDGSSIILTGSATGSTGTPALSVYAASKAAVRSFARNWILDLKLRRIRVNTISPGPINTPGLDRLVPNSEQRRQMQAMLADAIPLGRLGSPVEVAKAVTFLASEDSSFINGIELFIDGGMAQI